MARGGGQDLPRAETLPTAKASRHGARAKEFAPRGSRSPHVPTNGGPPSTDEQPEKHPLGEGLPTRRTSERICPAQEHAPRRRPPDTAHGRKDLPRGATLSSAKASRHGARAKRFAPRENAPHGEGIPTRREGERICPHARTHPSAKASRHGARAKGFASREKVLLGKGLPTRRTGEGICPAEFAFAPRADERRTALDRRTAGKTHLRRGRTREGAAAAEFIHRKK